MSRATTYAGDAAFAKSESAAAVGWNLSLRKVQKWVGVGALLLVAFAIGGCIPTIGFLKPSSQPRELVASAIIRTPSPVPIADGRGAGNSLVKIIAIDGKPHNYLENRAVVPPGVHTVDVELELKGSHDRGKHKTLVTKASTSLTFEAKPDSEYLIDTREDDTGLWVWVQDLENDEVVAGSKPTPQ